MLQRGAGPQSQSELGQSGQPGRSGSSSSLDLQSGRNGPRVAETAVPGEQYLIFTLLDREFAIQAEFIQGVERLTEITVIPNVASWVKGVINLRGSISSVVDLRAFLDIELLPYDPRTRLLSVKYNEMLICLAVDNVSEMVPIQLKAIDRSARSIPQWVASYCQGLAMVGKRQVILLDAARLLFADKMLHYLV